MSTATNVAKQMHTAMSLLEVRPVIMDDGTVDLIVDAQRLATREHDIKVWLLEYEGGQWSHAQSGTCGPLGQCLWDIARAYQIEWVAET